MRAPSRNPPRPRNEAPKIRARHRHIEPRATEGNELLIGVRDREARERIGRQIDLCEDQKRALTGVRIRARA